MLGVGFYVYISVLEKWFVDVGIIWFNDFVIGMCLKFLDKFTEYVEIVKNDIL